MAKKAKRRALKKAAPVAVAARKRPKKAPKRGLKNTANMAPYGQYALVQNGNYVGQVIEDAAGEHWYLYTAAGKNIPNTAAYLAPGPSSSTNPPPPVDVEYDYVGPVPKGFNPKTYGGTIRVPNKYVEASLSPGQDKTYTGLFTKAMKLAIPFQIDPQIVEGYFTITDVTVPTNPTQLGWVVCFTLQGGETEEHWFLLTPAAPYTQGGLKTSTAYAWVRVQGSTWFNVDSASGLITFDAKSFHNLIAIGATHTVADCQTLATYT